MSGKDRAIPKYGKRSASPNTAAMGGRFQDTVKISNLTYLYERDEVAANIIDMPTDDVFSEWLEIESESEDLKKAIEELNDKIKTKDELRETYRYARLYGYGLWAIGYADAAGKLEEGVSAEENKPTAVEYSNSISPVNVKKIELDNNPMSKDYGELKKYQITFTVDGSADDKWVHASRIKHLVVKSINNDPNGISLLKPLFDKFQVKKNMDWSLGEALVQNASPLRQLILPEDADDDEFDSAEVEFKDITAKDTFVSPEGYVIKVHDTGKALNPQPTIDYVMETIGGSARIPSPLLLGAQAGTVTGSEVNVKDYFKGIVSIQKNFIEPMLREFYVELQGYGLLPEGEFKIVWNQVWEMTEKEDAEIRLLDSRAEYLKAQMVMAYLKCGYVVEIDDAGDVKVTGEGVKPAEPAGIMSAKKAADRQISPERLKLYEQWKINTQDFINEFKAHFLLRHLIGQKRLITRFEEAHTKAMGEESSKSADDRADLLAELMKMDLSDAKLRELLVTYLVGAFKVGGERSGEMLAGNLGMTVLEPFELDDVQAREYIETGRLIYEDYKTKFVGLIKRSLMEGITAGESITQLKERIAVVGNKYEGNIDTLIRTEVHNAAEKGRIEGYLRNGLKQVEYINGPNPCDICSSLAGTIMTVEEAAAFTFPHPNCQCGFTPYLRGGFV